MEKGNLLEELTGRLAHYYGVFEDGTPIAYGGFGLLPAKHRLCVLLSIQADGVRKRALLVASLIEKARDLGAEEVTLEVREHNLPARKTYEHLGFFLRKTAPLLCRQWGRRRAHAPSPY